ncbi:conserved oligomeric Golgi complex subunit 8 [Ixodes scapularis]|uniref:conserved oligomeric Golgi complex subunit 8 n=1 Tax=Ixodes scapularis TaxID=6945 RepID=UPI001C3897EC|nr:conserved oligomeric Golgi complex subunit 8 [Ixodes scapularis]
MAAFMDGENESSYPHDDLFTVLGPPEKVDVWREDADIAAYLQELSSYQVPRLSQEPERLAEEKALVLEQTRELAFENYKTFIQTAQCSRDIFKEFGMVESKLDSMQEKLPEFAKKCQLFSQESQLITARWRQMSQMLSKHPQLLEVLELAQLMETCVRNGYYDEALELAAYVRRLEKKHASIPLITSIAGEVRESQQLMLNQLLHQLRSTIQLPACLKVIGYLRRMDCFSESELRVKFLQARGAWFQGVLSNIPNKDAYTHLSRVVEACRVHLFDIVTQYRAIFSDDDPLLGLSTKDSQDPGPSVFYSWITSRVSQFMRILETDLARDLGGRMDSVLSQCMYFGLSFSRVGADFRPLLAHRFQVAIGRRSAHMVQEATVRFEKMMESFTLVTLPSLGPAAMLMSTITTEEGVEPPLSLLEFEPLSQYCNGVLSAFNEVRLCSCLAIARQLSSSVETSLRTIVGVICRFQLAEESGLTEKEVETFSRFCAAFAHDLVPFLDRCLGVLFPRAEIAKMLGVTMAQVAKMENMGHLNCDMIIEPMKHLVSDFEEDFSVPASVDADEADDLSKSSAEGTKMVEESRGQEQKVPGELEVAATKEIVNIPKEPTMLEKLTVSEQSTMAEQSVVAEESTVAEGFTVSAESTVAEVPTVVEEPTVAKECKSPQEQEPTLVE